MVRKQVLTTYEVFNTNKIHGTAKTIKHYKSVPLPLWQVILPSSLS